MVRSFPSPSSYSELLHKEALRPDGTSTRSYLMLDEPSLAGLPEPLRSLWGLVGEALRSPALKEAVFRKLRVDVAARFGVAESDAPEVVGEPRAGLFRDVAGYRISPHPDVPSKVVTLQFYLPTDASQRHLGTEIYRMRPESRLHSAMKRLGLPAGGKFQTVKRFAFLPNTGYGFAVSRRSWHGRQTLSAETTARNTILSIYYQSDDATY
jgi:hypothetical protein